MRNAIRCIVADDEPLAVQLLADYIQKTPGCELIFHSTHILQVTDFLKEHHCDLIFLDNQMPELTGIQFLKQMNANCKVVFTTAYSEYALESYQFDVIDYILKPITYERFMASIDKFKRLVSAGEDFDNEPESIFIKTEYRIQQVNLSSVLFIEAKRDYLAFHTTEGKIMTLDSMRNMEQLLPSKRFIRIHKSYIINIGKIEFIERGKIVINQFYLPVGDYYKEHLSKIIRLK
jgi:two-component system LytT family response regulator